MSGEKLRTVLTPALPHISLQSDEQAFPDHARPVRESRQLYVCDRTTPGFSLKDLNTSTNSLGERTSIPAPGGIRCGIPPIGKAITTAPTLIASMITRGAESGEIRGYKHEINLVKGGTTTAPTLICNKPR